MYDMYDMYDSMMHTYFHMKTLEASSSLMNVRRAESAWLNVGACGQHVSHSTCDFILSWDVETGTIGDILVTRRRPWMSTVWVRKSLRHYGQRCMTYKISSFKYEWYIIYLTNIHDLQYWQYLGCPLNCTKTELWERSSSKSGWANVKSRQGSSFWQSKRKPECNIFNVNLLHILIMK